MQPEPAFPCPRACTDSSLLKLNGAYPQRQSGLWMQRIKIQGGALDAHAWQTLARFARAHTCLQTLQPRSAFQGVRTAVRMLQ